MHYGTTKLGSAICKKEYNMDYDHFSDDKLVCKTKMNEKMYDGIIIQKELINNEQH